MHLKRRVIVGWICVTAAIIVVGLTRWRIKKEISKQRRKKKLGSVNIGGKCKNINMFVIIYYFLS
jgi:hypothetical protein